MSRPPLSSRFCSHGFNGNFTSGMHQEKGKAAAGNENTQLIKIFTEEKTSVYCHIS